MNKSSLRKEYGLKRNTLSEKEIAEKSAMLAEYFFSFFSLKTSTTLHTFLSIPAKKEVQTEAIMERFRLSCPDGRIVVPKMTQAKGEMSCLLLEEGAILNVNGWGIPEPVNEILIPETEIDIVLVPLLVCDAQGNRVGYGKGFYDQFFLRCHKDVVKCGLSLFEPTQELIEADDWDIPLDYCITPSGVKSFTN